MSARHRGTSPARGGALATLPWRRAPLLLLRRPAVFVAIVAATAVLGIAAASGPLFLSTVGTASLASQAGQTCPENSEPGMTVTVPGARAAIMTGRGEQALRRQGLATPRVVSIAEARVQRSFVHVFAAAGALDHVRTLTPRGASGVWVPDTFAAKLGLRPGGSVTTGAGTALPVAGIYRDLAPDPFKLANLPRFFCSWSNAIVPGVPSESGPGPSSLALTAAPLLITDPATVARAAATPVRVSLHSPLSPQTNALGRFRTAADRAALAAATPGLAPYAEADDHLPRVIARAETARNGLAGSIVPIEVAGVVIAGLLVAGAGLFWANARRREIRLLVARGVGPGALAGKAVLETLPPAVVGGLAGWAVSAYLVRAVGPADVFEPGAVFGALGLVGAVLAAGLLLIAAVGAVAGRERTSGRSASWAARIPWELLLVAAAVVIAATRLDDSAVTVENAIVRISPLVILYPLLGVTGVLLLLGRAVGLLLPLTGRAAGRGPSTLYLAFRRMSRSRAVAVGLLIGTALPCCLLMYGSTVRASVSDEVRSKYQTNLGAPHVLAVYGVRGRQLDLRGTGAQVTVYDQDAALGATSDIADLGNQVTVLGVDPAMFGRFAFLTGSQRADLARVTAPADGPAPVVVANASGPLARTLHVGRTSIPVDPVARPAVFPGLRDGSSPLVIVNERFLRGVDPNAERNTQLWTDDAHYGPARRLVASDTRLNVLYELTSKVVIDTTGLLPVTWVFGYLQALALLVGFVALAGLVFGLAARTRARRVSYVLARRMGMRRRTHVASLVVELGVVLGLGWVAGSSLGIGSFGLIVDRLDMYPSLPPPPAFTVPGTPLVVTAVLVAVVVLVATLAVQALAERTRPAEILRLE
ncbi:FtsX-like permease family protein [Jatrophihabitans fulvus]